MDNVKKLMFYSEKNGFYKYYKDVIEYILAHSDIVIHYVTSDPNDDVFSRTDGRIVPYYVDDNRLIPLMMKADADMVVMTMPDLGAVPHQTLSCQKGCGICLYVPLIRCRLIWCLERALWIFMTRSLW